MFSVAKVKENYRMEDDFFEKNVVIEKIDGAIEWPD